MLEPGGGVPEDAPDLTLIVDVGADLNKVVRGQVRCSKVVARFREHDVAEAGGLVVEVERRA